MSATALMHHTQLGPQHMAGNGGVGRYVLFPGDPSRAERIAARFVDRQTVGNPRGHTAHIGALIGEDGVKVDVMAIASGMGTGSTEVILHELLSVGARRVLRVGSCGAMVDGVRPGGVVIVTGAVRDEATTHHYAPAGYPAVASPDCVAAMTAGAAAAGLEAWTWRGLCHTKDSLYAREFGHGPNGAENLRYKEWLSRCGVAASDMEASAIFVMCATWAPAPLGPLSAGPDRVQGGCVLAVYAGHDSDMHLDEGVVEQAQQRAVEVSLAGVLAWAAQDRAAGA
jgi:uridine phosphorylase